MSVTAVSFVNDSFDKMKPTAKRIQNAYQIRFGYCVWPQFRSDCVGVVFHQSRIHIQQKLDLRVREINVIGFEHDLLVS
jgi:hypothetical protein